MVTYGIVSVESHHPAVLVRMVEKGARVNVNTCDVGDHETIPLVQCIVESWLCRMSKQELGGRREEEREK